MAPKAEPVKAHKSIHEALLAVMNQVGYVQKAGKNKMQDYKYAGEADFIAAIRPHMIENGVTFNCAASDVQFNSLILSEKDGISKYKHRVYGTFGWRFFHVDSSTEISVTSIGEGMDHGDKASYKAMTGALKYALRQTLLIETGDDPEKDSEPAKENKVFPNAAKRTDFCNKLTDLMRNAIDLEELRGMWGDHIGLLTELKNSSVDYDQTSFEHLEKIKEQCKTALIEAGKILDDEIR